MRDTRRPESYFQKKLQSDMARIQKFQAILDNTPLSNEQGIRIGKLQLARLHLDCTKTAYSMGAGPEEMYGHFLSFLGYYKEVCTPADSVYDVIDALSLGVLFESSKAEFLPALEAIVERFTSQDGLIHFLIRRLQEQEADKLPSQLAYFNRLTKEDDKAAVLALELSQWYQHHKGAHWYNSHNSKNSTYCGYWCFEIAALAKILEIDDTPFALNPYYPYDLAHH